MALVLTTTPPTRMSVSQEGLPDASDQAATAKVVVSPTPAGASLRLPRPPRVGHKKSRKGCAQCKRRHVKCNEESPCSNCLRHGVACSLAGGPLVRREDARPRRKSAASSSNASVPGTSPPKPHAVDADRGVPSLERSLAASECDHFAILTSSIDRPLEGTGSNWQLDLQLMHHYMANTAAVITEHSRSDFLLQIWRHELPKVAFAYEYVMHALLALTALHKASQEPDQSAYLRTCAAGHLDQAVLLYRQDSSIITRDTANPRFVFMSLSALLAYAVQRVSISTLDAVFEILLLVSGVDAIVAETWCSVAQGVFAPILTRGFTDAVPIGLHPLPDGMDFGLAHLDFMLSIEPMLPDDRRACISVLTELKELYQALLRHNAVCSVASMICFPKQEPKLFANLVKRRNPQGLIILAYYCVLLDVLDRWWIRGWAARILKAIVGELDEVWRHWVEWPVRAVLFNCHKTPGVEAAISEAPAGSEAGLLDSMVMF